MTLRIMKSQIRVCCSILFALICLPLISRAQDVSYNYVQDVDFSKYKTYKWVDIEGVEVPNQLLSQDIRKAIEVQLATKGLTDSENNPQLFIAYQLSINQEKRITSYSSGGDWPYGPGWRYGYAGPSMSTATSSTIHIGNLVLDIYDAEKEDLVWRGEASKTLSPSKDPDKNRKKIDKAMAKLLKNYPPKKSK